MKQVWWQKLQVFTTLLDYMAAGHIICDLCKMFMLGFGICVDVEAAVYICGMELMNAILR